MCGVKSTHDSYSSPFANGLLLFLISCALWVRDGHQHDAFDFVSECVAVVAVTGSDVDVCVALGLFFSPEKYRHTRCEVGLASNG